MPLARIKKDRTTGAYNVVYQGGGEHISGLHDKEHARSIAKQHNELHSKLRTIDNSSLKTRAQHLNAQANLLEQERLSAKVEHLNQIGKEAAKLENKTPMTSQSLGILGAGKEFGA